MVSHFSIKVKQNVLNLVTSSSKILSRRNRKAFSNTDQYAIWHRIDHLEPLSVAWRETGHYLPLDLRIWQISAARPCRFLWR